MRAITIQAHVGEDGILRLAVPVEVADTDLEVVVVVHVPGDAPARKRPWPEGFFERTAGSLRDTPIERAPQGEIEVRAPLG